MHASAASHALRRSILLLVLLAGLAASAGALAYVSFTAEENMVNSYAFLYAHPDIKFRRKGLEAYDAGEHALAYKHFRTAARYADKPSQAMVAAMLWHGEGVTQDRAAAYAWMDLAAERSFAAMLAKREKYWEAMGESERSAALAIGKDLYAEFGDEVAKGRLERKLRLAKYERTGSRVGFVGNLTVGLNVEGERMNFKGHQYYNSMFWEPKEYWAWQDSEWKDAPGGVVDIGPLRTPDE